MKKPAWIKKSVNSEAFQTMQDLMVKLNVNTVCFDASCPNIGTCFHERIATFLILGNECTRNCRFCGIKSGKPEAINENEPKAVLKAIRELELNYAVITSVTRDDLEDQGLFQFVNILKLLRNKLPDLKIELLIPDFYASEPLITSLLKEKPDVLAHNLETIKPLYPEVRPKSSYDVSLNVLYLIKKINPCQILKTGFMVGLGESMGEIQRLISDISETQCDILTVGQYLQPSSHQLEVKKYYTENEFQKIKQMAQNQGIKKVVAGPFIRSSYNGFKIYKSMINFNHK